MAINFPNSPALDATFTDGSTSWQWDGTTWNLVTSTANVTPNTFKTISVSGQDDIVAATGSDTLTITAGSNITLTTDAGTKAVTINGQAGGGGGDVNQNALSNIAVSGQTTVAATSVTDTFTFVGGSGINITTSGKNITFTNSASTATFNTLTDTSTASLTVDKIYLPAITRLVVTNNLTTSYRFDQYGTQDNPVVYAINGTTIAFDLQAGTSHPFEVQDPIGNAYNEGLVHVATNGTVSTGAAANGQSTGTLYWKIPSTISGGYRYQCTNHASMVGNIQVKDFSTL